MTLTFYLYLDSVNMNQHAEYLGQSEVTEFKSNCPATRISPTSYSTRGRATKVFGKNPDVLQHEQGTIIYSRTSSHRSPPVPHSDVY